MSEEKELLLREDRRLLGRLLGDVIGEQVGEQTRERIENIRQTAVAFRRSGEGKAELEKQLDALFGWDGGRMASLYTRKADRDRLAREAMEKMAQRTVAEQRAPSPGDKVRALAPKTK